MAFDMFPILGSGISPTKTSSTGVTTTPATNLTAFIYTTNGSYLQYQDLTVAASVSALLPAGFYNIVVPHASVKVQVTTDGGTTWVDMIAVNTISGLFWSDGASFRLNNAAGSASLITVLTPNGGMPSGSMYANS